MNNILKNLHYFIFIYTLWISYQSFEILNVAIEGKKVVYKNSINRLKSKKRKMLKINKFKSKLKESEKDFLVLKKNLLLIQDKLPIKFNKEYHLEVMEKIAKEINIKKINLSVGRQENKGYYFVNDMTLSMNKITYLQVLIFLEKLSESTSLYNLKKMNVTGEKDTTRGKYQLVKAKILVQVYRRNSSTH